MSSQTISNTLNEINIKLDSVISKNRNNIDPIIEEPLINVEVEQKDELFTNFNDPREIFEESTLA